MSALWFGIAALATYRVALMISSEDGPFNALLWLRNLFTADTSWIAKGIRCLWCVSFWAGAFIGLWLVLTGAATIEEWPLVWLGLSGAAIIIDRYWKR